MTTIEESLFQVLEQLQQAVRVRPAESSKPDLLPIFARLDELTAALPPEADPTLAHYLRKKSYEKARLWLLGREAENRAGDCGHVE